MTQYLINMYAWLVSWQTLPTATEQIDAVLGTFDGMVSKLNAAIDQLQSEVDASYDRQHEAAWAADVVYEREQELRAALYAAETRATIARDRIAALTGGN